MTASRAVLTDRYLKSLKPAPAGKRIVHWDAAKPSFGVRVTDRGVISFFVMRRMPGKPQPVRVLLGRYPDIGLAQARTLATAAIGDLVSGIHPRDREQPRSTPAPSPRSLRPSSPALPPPGSAPPRDQKDGRPASAAALGQSRRIAHHPRRRHHHGRGARPDGRPLHAAKALALASAIFRHAMMREQIASNPCTLIRISGLRRRHGTAPACPDRCRDRAAVAGQSGGREPIPAGPFARLLLLTAVRRSEAAHMTWGEVNLDDALWIVPAQPHQERHPA